MEYRLVVDNIKAVGRDGQMIGRYGYKKLI